MLYTMRHHALLIWGIIFASLLTEVASSVNPVILGMLIDAASAYVKELPVGTASLTWVTFLVLLYPVSRLLVVLGIRGTGYAMGYLTAYMRTEAYRTLFGHLSLHSQTYFNNRFAGSLSSDVGITAQNMTRMMNFFVYSVFSLLIAIISSFVIIATANGILALAFLGGIIILIPINYALSKKAVLLSKEAIKALSKLRGRVVDAITNITAIQHFSRQKAEMERLEGTIQEYQNTDIKADIYSETVLLINNVLVMTFIGLIMFGAFILWRDEAISLGQFVMVLTLTTTVIRGLTRIGSSVNEFSSMYGETRHTLQEVLKEHDIADSQNAQPLVVKNGEIEFKEVAFSYKGGSDVFENMSLVIKPGERVGVVGPSGGGKSTFVKLLLRQHEIDSGEICIDNTPITEVTQQSLRNSIGVVPQEPMLFHRSVLENIAYGKEGATYEEVEAVAKRALIHDFIMTLPNKYDTLVGERGVKLSGGQKQRIVIARAMLKTAPILLLDEATSSLDSESEVYIQKGLHELMKNKTVIAIAHRLSTLQEMARILVFKDGGVVQDGSPEELLKDADGVYATLWKHQAGGYIGDDVT